MLINKNKNIPENSQPCFLITNEEKNYHDPFCKCCDGIGYITIYAHKCTLINQKNHNNKCSICDGKCYIIRDIANYNIKNRPKDYLFNNDNNYDINNIDLIDASSITINENVINDINPENSQPCFFLNNFGHDKYCKTCLGQKVIPKNAGKCVYSDEFGHGKQCELCSGRCFVII